MSGESIDFKPLPGFSARGTYYGEKKIRGRVRLTSNCFIFKSKEINLLFPLKGIKETTVDNIHKFFFIEMPNGELYKFKLSFPVNWIVKIDQIKRVGGGTVVKIERGGLRDAGIDLDAIEWCHLLDFNMFCTYLGKKRESGNLKLTSKYLLFNCNKYTLFIPVIDIEEAVTSYKPNYLEIEMANGDMYEFRLHEAIKWVKKIEDVRLELMKRRDSGLPYR